MLEFDWWWKKAGVPGFEPGSKPFEGVALSVELHAVSSPFAPPRLALRRGFSFQTVTFCAAYSKKNAPPRLHSVRGVCDPAVLDPCFIASCGFRLRPCVA